jgi:hypothetical protein
MPTSGPEDLRVAPWALDREPVAAPGAARPAATPASASAPSAPAPSAAAPPPPGASLEELVRQAIAAVMRDA